MEQGLNLALQFIRDVPQYKFPPEYYEPGDDSEREIITLQPGAETVIISAKTANGEQITIYWDMSYGAVLVKVSSAGGPIIKRLNGIVREQQLTQFQQQQIAELGITSIRILKYQLEFAKDKSGNPQLIIIQTITEGVDTTHGCNTWGTLIYNLDGQLLFEIGGHQELRSGWINWYLTPDARWIILWQPNEFQPIFHRISDLEARLEKKGSWLRIDRLDWVPTISPYLITSFSYKPCLESKPDKPGKTDNHNKEYGDTGTGTITLEAYKEYLISIHELKLSETDEFINDGYLEVNVNEWPFEYTGSFSREDFAGKLGISSSHHSRDSHIPITVKCEFMIDLHRRRLIPIKTLIINN